MLSPVPKPTFNRRVPKQSKRNEFSKRIRKEIFDRDDGLCRVCRAPATQVHHVKYRSAGGRGVFTNGLSLCQKCHEDIHANRDKADFWRNIFAEMYGENYYKDEWD